MRMTRARWLRGGAALLAALALAFGRRSTGSDTEAPKPLAQHAPKTTAEAVDTTSTDTAVDDTTATIKSLVGKVIAVGDGDTITVLTAEKKQVKIRMAGIDAPEKAQAFGTVAKQHLSDRIFGRDVTIEWEKEDFFHRTVGKVLLEGEDICLEQIRAGLAWHFRKYRSSQPPADRESYAAAEVAAREARLGLWQDEDPLPPEKFRRSAKKKNKRAADDEE